MTTPYEVRCYDENYRLVEVLHEDTHLNACETFDRMRNSCPGFRFVEMVHVRSFGRQVMRRFERHAA